MRRALLPLYSLPLLFFIFACNNKPAPPPPPELRVSDAGADLAAGSRVVHLPPVEVEAAAAKPVQDEAGKRFAYFTTFGDARLVYAIGDALWLGPRVKLPVDFRSVPSLDDALGAIFVEAGPKRAALAADVTKALGDAGVARMLAEGPGADGPEWDEIFAKLPPPRQEDVKASLAKLLEKGKPTAGLRRVVTKAKLGDAAVLDARVRELASPLKEPQAAAVMLRALGTLDAANAAATGCAVLAAKSSPEDPPGRDALAEAALLAIAHEAFAGKPVACEADVAAALEQDTCHPSLRCAAGKPLTGRETSKQDEPLCTKAELEPVVARAAAEPPTTVLDAQVRPPLFAYAALAATNKVPAAFEQAHARRRYAIAQPKEPACDSGVALGAACRCEEAVLRDLACRNLGSSSGHVGLCKFDVDDKQKKITNVVSAIGASAPAGPTGAAAPTGN